MSAQPKQERYRVRKLSSGFWYICDVEKAKRERWCGQIGRPHATKAEAEAALVRLNTPISFSPFGGDV